MVAQKILIMIFDQAESGLEQLAKDAMPDAQIVASAAPPESSSTMIGLAYSSNVDDVLATIADTPNHFSHAVLMHPKAAINMGNADLSKLKVFITAGASDPESPAAGIGDLAEVLEAQGADVKTWWHAGGGEITDAERDAVKAWLAEVSASLEGSADLPIQHEDDGKKGRFFMRSASGHEAEMTYTWTRPDSMIIDHTEVPDVFRGQGAGVRLFMTLVEAARADGFKIVPLCPFAAAQFKKHPELADLLDKDFAPK